MNIQVPQLSLSSPLPPVIQKQPSMEQKQEPVEEKETSEDFDKPVLILHTRDISSDEERLCQKFGTVRHFNPSMVNIPLETVKAQYIFVDIRDKYYRIQIAKVDTDKFRVCALVNPWEKHNNIFDTFVDEINILTKLPFDVKVAFKHEYDDLLCAKKLIKSPGNSCLSLLSYLVNIWDELKRK